MHVDILIPTMDNRQYLEPCIASIVRWTRGLDYQIVVINNGRAGSCAPVRSLVDLVVEADGNRGWTGGLALGLERGTADYVLFLNDDTLILPGDAGWLRDLWVRCAHKGVGAVGPASNCTIGAQSIFAGEAPLVAQVPYLVGFCMLVRREALDAVGGVDPSLPGGDDLDLSIRLRQNFWSLLADRSVFVYHHGFVTGTRVHGPAHMPLGWNSREYSETVYRALLAKHGHEGLRMIAWEG